MGIMCFIFCATDHVLYIIYFQCILVTELDVHDNNS